MKIRDKILQILSEKGPATHSQINELFDMSEKLLVEATLADLVDTKVVKQVRRNADKVFMLSSRHPLHREEERQETHALAATLPESILSLNPTVLKTRQVFDDIISSTQHDLAVSQPFIDESFVEVYSERFREAAKRGMRLRLVTRKLRDDFHALRSVLRLFEIFSMHSKRPDAIVVYEHWIPIRTGNYLRQFVGLHAKIVLGDNEAYVGSANWTEYSLSNNVEMGLLIRDHDTLLKLRDLLGTVMAHSTIVDLPAVHERATQPSRH